MQKGSNKYGLRDIFYSYKAKAEKPVDLKTYLAIAKAFLKFTADKIVNGKRVSLPARMGDVGIIGSKKDVKLDESGNITGLAPDWKKTKELWANCSECKENKQLVFHLNEHTQGIRYRMHWFKTTPVENKSLYSLKFTRANTRSVSKLIQDGKEYLVILK